ncbi:glycosyltransferase family 2 protein [Alicyclobacillus sp. SP_1]|uniref:glycosyltransferase n=1 Tax=Alicyclobacillus sp. SP_1 TaxID=2942475 RepID=UPI0021583370|nr:glycosyltransferase [Alicyclobacillus sp. SP_1]
MMLLWTVVALLGILFEAMVVLINLRAWPRLQPPGPSAGLVSALVPARNEARCIERCLSGLIEQTYRPLEILCLDDESEDNTKVLAEDALRTADSQSIAAKVLCGRPFVVDAMHFGKAHACQQLAESASGEWLLFTDADTHLAKDAVSRLVTTAIRHKAQLVTGFPRVENNTWTGWLSTSLMVFTIALHLPVSRVQASPSPMYVAGSGMCMLFERSMYEHIGGHLTSGQHLVDDMELARSVKRSGGRVALVDISDAQSVHMYTSAKQVWHGFGKNLYAGIGRNPLLLGFVTVWYALLFIWPLVSLLVDLTKAMMGLSVPPLSVIASALALLLSIALKAVVDRRFHTPLWVSCWMPMSAALLIGLAWYSAWRSWFRLGYYWKGRTYS